MVILGAGRCVNEGPFSQQKNYQAPKNPLYVVSKAEEARSKPQEALDLITVMDLYLGLLLPALGL